MLAIVNSRLTAKDKPGPNDATGLWHGRAMTPIRLFVLAGTGLVVAGALGLGAWWALAPAGAPEQTRARIGADPMPTAAIEDESATAPADLPQGDLETLDAALTALYDDRLDEARRLRDDLPEGSADRDLVTWAIALSGKRGVTAGEIADATENLPDWPHRDVLARNHERALARGLVNSIRLRAAFAERDPVTFEAAYALARSHLLTGNPERAHALIAPWWHSEPLSAPIEIELANTFAEQLTRDDHRRRYFNMMARDRIRSGARIAEAAGTGGLHNAWAAVIRRQRSADRLLDEVPQELRDTEAFVFMQVSHLRHRQAFEEAAALIARFDESGMIATNPDAWWTERRIVSRSIRERGDIETAYPIVANHSGGDAETVVDAAFHAGWYALRGLGEPERARAHFEVIEQVAVGPASRARGAYWLGRTAEAAGDDAAARGHFERAAGFPTVFYGQIAAQKLGADRLALTEPEPGSAALARLGRQAPFVALERLERTAHDRLRNALYYGLAEHYDSPAHIAALAGLAARNERHTTALRVAKRAAWRGVDVGLLTHPVGAIPASAQMSPRDRAVAYAIARQESEFNTNAVSRADARGLLQLLPSTARAVASRMDLSYAPARLTDDPAFNAALGTRYLDEQLARFGGSYVLTFIAYNAGPGRAREWLERFGDPRGLPLEDTIDWVEQIPFPETRFYVQKVLENLTVYKARFGLDLTIAQDLTTGSG